MPLAIRDDVVYENFKPIVVLTLPCIVHYVKLHLIIAFLTSPCTTPRLLSGSLLPYRHRAEANIIQSSLGPQLTAR
jgi:hypothetical protein